jgi:hypothetical protein
MAAPQFRVDQDVTPAIRLDDALVRDNETILTDGGRVVDLEQYTVMARNSTNKLVPLTSLTATDGTSIPTGLMAQSVAAAEIAAGDVTGVALYVKIGRINEASIILENSLALDNVIVDRDQTIRDLLMQMGIYPEPGADVDRAENP